MPYAILGQPGPDDPQTPHLGQYRVHTDTLPHAPSASSDRHAGSRASRARRSALVVRHTASRSSWHSITAMCSRMRSTAPCTTSIPRCVSSRSLGPASFVGSYPRPSWFGYNLRDRDVVAALREEEFAEAYRDGIRAQIGDQEEVGLNILADPHLWYDKHQGFIASFVLYNAQRFDGVETRIEPNPFFAQMAQTPEMAGTQEVFDAIANLTVAITGKLGRGKLHHSVNWALAQRCTTKPVTAFFAVGPVEQSMMMVDEHYRDRRALLRDLADVYHAETVIWVADRTEGDHSSELSAPSSRVEVCRDPPE
jgi:hypothetical protein